MTKFFTTAAFVLAMSTAAPAQALIPLHQEPTVRSMFYAIGLADEVRRNCPSISARMVRAYLYLRSIESYARKAGYSEDQIRDLADNKAEKEKLRVVIRADLAKRGVTPGSSDGYCKVGLEEIARGTASGRLLQAN